MPEMANNKEMGHIYLPLAAVAGEAAAIEALVGAVGAGPVSSLLAGVLKASLTRIARRLHR